MARLELAVLAWIQSSKREPRLKLPHQAKSVICGGRALTAHQPPILRADYTMTQK